MAENSHQAEEGSTGNEKNHRSEGNTQKDETIRLAREKEIRGFFSTIFLDIENRSDLTTVEKRDVEEELTGLCREFSKKEKAELNTVERELRNVGRISPEVLKATIAIIENRIPQLGEIAERIIKQFKALPGGKGIYILGLKQAGKSTFIAVLNLALTIEQSLWTIEPYAESNKKLSRMTKDLFVQGFYPEPTMHEQEMSFTVWKDSTTTILGRKPGARFLLCTADVPGEAVEGPSSEDAIYHEFYEKYLKGCTGIIFLLDYEEKWRENMPINKNSSDFYFRFFTSILAKIHEQTGTYPYTALCITKADQIPGMGPNSEFDKTGYCDDIEGVAEKILGRNTKALIDRCFDMDHLIWIPVSATGFIGEGKDRRTQFITKTDQDGKPRNGIINPGDLTPIGVAEALEWVLDNVANDDESILIKQTGRKNFSDIVKGVRRFLRI